MAEPAPRSDAISQRDLHDASVWLLSDALTTLGREHEFADHAQLALLDHACEAFWLLIVSSKQSWFRSPFQRWLDAQRADSTAFGATGVRSLHVMLVEQRARLGMLFEPWQSLSAASFEVSGERNFEPLLQDFDRRYELWRAVGLLGLLLQAPDLDDHMSAPPPRPSSRGSRTPFPAARTWIDELAREVARRMETIPSDVAPAPPVGTKTLAGVTFNAGELMAMASEVAPPPPTDQSHPMASDDVQFTVYRPRTLPPSRWSKLLAFAHPAEKRPDAPPDALDPLAQVQQQAQALLGAEHADFRALSEDASQPIPLDARLTFVPEVAGVEFEPARHSIRWLGDVQHAEFRLRPSSVLAGSTAHGQITVLCGSFVVAEIALSLRVGATGRAVDEAHATASEPASFERSEPARMYRKIFASYSHLDAAIVEQVRGLIAALGDRYLIDVSELRAGERWTEALERLIREADVFQLFWSSRSMRSPFVRQEWEYALSLARPNFVRPTYWEQPLPASSSEGLPPPALLELHFQSIRDAHVSVPVAPQPVAPRPPAAQPSAATTPERPDAPQSFALDNDDPPAPRAGRKRMRTAVGLLSGFAVAAAAMLFLKQSLVVTALPPDPGPNTVTASPPIGIGGQSQHPSEAERLAAEAAAQAQLEAARHAAEQAAEQARINADQHHHPTLPKPPPHLDPPPHPEAQAARVQLLAKVDRLQPRIARCLPAGSRFDLAHAQLTVDPATGSVLVNDLRSPLGPRADACVRRTLQQVRVAPFAGPASSFEVAVKLEGPRNVVATEPLHTTRDIDSLDAFGGRR